MSRWKVDHVALPWNITQSKDVESVEVERGEFEVVVDLWGNINVKSLQKRLISKHSPLQESLPCSNPSLGLLQHSSLLVSLLLCVPPTLQCNF
jgi:hypothetical protein